MNIKEYLNIKSYSDIPHREIYTKVVTDIGLGAFESYMPVSIDKLREALKADEYLNTIALAKWDNAAKMFGYNFTRIGVNQYSLSQAVCTLKQAARMLVEREDNKAEA